MWTHIEREASTMRSVRRLRSQRRHASASRLGGIGFLPFPAHLLTPKNGAAKHN